MTIVRFHHAQITIPPGAEDDARRFYSGLLGLPEISKPASLIGRGAGALWAAWVAVGEMQVHIGTEDGVDRHATKAHLAYEVTDIVLWREKLAGEGIAILDGIPILGYDRFEARDPFGNRIEFIARMMAPHD